LTEEKAKKIKLRGFPATFARRIEGVEEYENFKEFSKDISIKLLLNPTDAKFATFLKIEKGTITIEGVPNNNPENLKKKVLDWDGRMTTDLRTFLKYAAGEMGLGTLIKKILTRNIKVRGLLYFVLIEKLFSFKREIEKIQEPKPVIETNKRKNIIISRLFFFIGFIHVAILILSYGNRELFGHALIFGFFSIWLGSMITKLSKANVITERPVLISCTTLTFLNIIMYTTFLIVGTAGERFFINYLMLVAIALDVICFMRFFAVRTKLEQMDSLRKLDYFSIVIIRGLGLGLLIGILSWIIPPNINPIMIIYTLIFGTLNMTYGTRLITKADEKEIQFGALVVLIAALVVMIFLVFNVGNIKCVVYILLYYLVIILRVYYIKREFY